MSLLSRGLFPESEGPLVHKASARTRRQLQNVLSLDDFEQLAARVLPRPIFGYISSGSETNAAVRDNRRAFSDYALVPRTLVDVSERSQATSLFGITYRSPFGIAPIGFSALSAYRGDLVLAAAAARLGMAMIVSGASLIRLEDVGRAAPQAWFQAYLPGRAEPIRRMLRRLEHAGFGTLVLTVDVPVVSNRENSVRSGFSAPLRPSLRLAWDGLVRPRWTFGTFLRTLARHGMPHFENGSADRGPPIVSRRAAAHLDGRDQFDWNHLELVRREWKGRLVLKGILDANDAAKAVEQGVDGLIVSNHGGRQLDSTPAPLRVLPRIVEAVADRIPIMLDGGVRRGTDVLKAMALGASFVFVGRPFIYSAAVAGDAGVDHLHRLLSSELDRDMALLGVRSLSEICREHLLRIE